MTVLFSITATAGINYFQEANAGENLPGGNGNLGFATNYVNLLENPNYQTCSIIGGQFSPVIADMDDDNIPDIISMETNNLRIYDTRCNIIQEISLSKNSISPPIIANMDEDAYQEIIFTDYDSIHFYEFDGSQVSLGWTVNYSALLGGTTKNVSINKITCSRQALSTTEKNVCILKKEGEDASYTYYYENDTMIKRTSLLGATQYNEPFYNGIASGFVLTNFYTPICHNYGSDNDIICLILENDGAYNGKTIEVVGGSYTVDTIYYNSAWIAKLGGAYRLFTNMEYQKAAAFDFHAYKVYDTSMNNIYNVTKGTSASSSNKSSNWMVADYNKDGNNLACIVTADDNTNKTYLRCLDETFASNIVNKDITSLNVTITKNFVMADFYPDESTLGIANSDGIYYDTKRFNTSLTISNTNRSGIIVSSPVSGSPIVIFTDTSSFYVMYDYNDSLNCGNGVCDVGESAFNCDVDCGLNATVPIGSILNGDSCINNTNCISGICTAFVCEGKPGGVECVYDAECMSGDCDNTMNICTSVDIKDTVDNMTDILGFRSTLSKMLLALLVIIAFTIGGITTGAKVAGVFGGGVAGIVCFFASLFMSVLVFGWLGLWVVFMLVFFVIVGLVFLFFLSGNGG